MHTVIDESVTTTATANLSSIRLLSTRFGEVSANIDNAFIFEHGPLGLPGKEKFCLIDFLESRDDQFKLFQCVDAADVGFVVIPAAYRNPLILEEDLDEACEILEIDSEKLLLLFIVSTSNNKGKKQFFVNAKAPILVNIANRTATQYIFQNPEYKLRHRVA